MKKQTGLKSLFWLTFAMPLRIMQHKKTLRGFSLIEILISLIIISLLIAAFTPIITKKLKASDISIGSFGSGSNINMTLERQVTKEDCDKYDAIFIPAAMNGGVRNLCVTKYNMGDNDLPLAKSVKKLDAANSCSEKDKGNCCWGGTTSTACGNSGNGDSDYSGCNRTVCQFQAANASCAAYAPNDENEGSWRLPSQEEINNWAGNLANLNNNKGKEGLQLCDYSSSNNGAVQCYINQGKCQTGTSSSDCLPNRIWSMTMLLADTHFSDGIDGGAFNGGGNIADAAGLSARCVLDSIAVDVSELPNGGGIKDPTTDPFYGEPKDQADCDKIVAIFIDKKMSGANRNICVSKYNVGDAGPDGFGPPVPDSFKQYIMNVSQSCTYAGSCCWKGKTTSTCGITGNAGANYSGCNRTVCQYNAANAACRQYNAFGATAVGAWRLPTSAELSVWWQHMNVLNNNKGANGLQFCTHGSVAGYVQCSYVASCFGSGSYDAYGSSTNYCMPSLNWTSTPTVVYKTEGGATATNLYAVASARCVYDGITKANNYEEDLSDYDDSNAPKDEPKSQADCDKLTAIFIHKKYAGGGRNICISKYNVGDSGPSGKGPTLPSAYSGYIVNAGQSCPYSGFCCWRGATSSPCSMTGNAGADYSGCNRTVCQFNAANEACRSWTANGKTPAGAWRLPSQNEFNSMFRYLDIINNNRGKDGLQLCTHGTSASGSVPCSYLQSCIGSGSYDAYGSSTNYCMPSLNWTSTPTVVYKTEGGATATNLYAVASARCVYDGATKANNYEEDLSNYDDSNAPTDEPKSQADCDKLTAIFVHKKYAGSTRNICISKYNVGDSGPSGSGPVITAEYQQYIKGVGQSCNKSGSCCWRGATSSPCSMTGNAGADYSGCNRTVCQYNAANAACRSWTANGKTPAGYWRLPLETELNSMFNYLNIINNNRGKDGLQLCSHGISTIGTTPCSYVASCFGSGSYSAYGSSTNYCMPSLNWTSTPTVVYKTEGGATATNLYAVASARCVYDGSKTE